MDVTMTLHVQSATCKPAFTRKKVGRLNAGGGHWRRKKGK